jgi:hypothetical protein
MRDTKSTCALYRYYTVGYQTQTKVSDSSIHLCNRHFMSNSSYPHLSTGRELYITSSSQSDLHHRRHGASSGVHTTSLSRRGCGSHVLLVPQQWDRMGRSQCQKQGKVILIVTVGP